MSPNKASPKSRHEKLRSSCDSCYSSKVKCSKTRPLCSRCLVCGTDCTYSPSARVGRKSKSKGEPSAKEIHSLDHSMAHPKDALNGPSNYYQMSTSSSQAIVPHGDHELSVQNLNSSLDYLSNTQAISGYVTPTPSDRVNSMLFLNTQVAPGTWIQDPGRHESLPWTPEVLCSSVPSPEMILPDSTIPWTSWYDSDADQLAYIDPGVIQYTSDPSTINLQYECSFPDSA